MLMNAINVKVITVYCVNMYLLELFYIFVVLQCRTEMDLIRIICHEQVFS